MLFLIAFDDIITELREEGIEIYAYCDDLAVTGEGMQKLETAIEKIFN